MATIKSYTDIEQSKKLAEILPIESADMRYERVCFDRPPEKCWYIKLNPPFKSDDIIPCWSLAALLSVLPEGTRLLKSATDDIYHCDCPQGNVDMWFDNPVDACYELILKLHEQKIL